MFGKWVSWEEQQAFPGVKLEELFSSVKPYEPIDPVKISSEGNLRYLCNDPSDRRAYWTIGRYLSGRIVDGSSFALTVTAAPKLADWIKENMLAINYDTKHFEAIVWTDGRVLLLVNYGQIIGSRCLTIVPLEKFNAWSGLQLRAVPKTGSE